jgi:proliferating cell nuclear antigen
MKLTLADPKYLRDSITIISELVNEASFKITPESVELVAMDPANVAMVIFKLFSSCFVEYDVAKAAEIAINLNNLKQILRRAKPNDMLTLELDKDNKLKITLKGTNTRTFAVPLIELEEKEQRVPSLNFELSVQANSELIDEAVEDSDIVAESVSLSVEPKKFIIEAAGDMSNAKIEMKPGDGLKLKYTGSDKVKAKYSIEYLKKIIKGSKLAENVLIEFAKDYPLKVTYNETDKFVLSFILAPRVENE